MSRNVASFIFLLATAAAMPAGLAENLPQELLAERNPGKRSELAIELAARALEQARAYYQSGKVAQADAQLDTVEELAEECLDSAEKSHKEKYWKRAEMKTEALSRRIRYLIDDLNYDQRAKAQTLEKQISLIHDKLLAGVMSK